MANSIHLNPDIKIHPHDGVRHLQYVVEDTGRKKLFRIGRREYLMISAIADSNDVSKAAIQAQAVSPEIAWSKESIENILRWLLASGLATLDTESAADLSVDITEHEVLTVTTDNVTTDDDWHLAMAYEKPRLGNQRQNAIAPSRLWDPLSFQLTLVSGDLVTKWASGLTWLCSRWGLAAACALVVAGCICFANRYDHYCEISLKLFVPGAQWWWLAAWLILKVVHEMGHALACVALGGTVRKAGVSIFCGAPIPFVDVTDVWKMNRRFDRILCTSMGMIVELGFAAIAIIVLCCTEIAALQYFCAAIATMGTVVTLAFNANPLMRFDGYYVLSDLLGQPQLWTSCQNAWNQWWRACLGLRMFPSCDQWPRAFYGFLCNVYRMIMLVGLAWWTIATWQGFAILPIGWGIYAWFVRPWLLQRQAAYRMAPKTSEGSLHPIAGLITAMLILSLWLPSPWQAQSPAYVDFVDPVDVRFEADGFVTEVIAGDGQTVKRGEPIVRLANPKISQEFKSIRMEYETSKERCHSLRAEERIADLQSEEAKMLSLEKQMQEVERRLHGLTVTAGRDGRLIGRDLKNCLGRYVAQGSSIGMIASWKDHEIVALVGQSEIDLYRHSPEQDVCVVLSDGRKIKGKVRQISPRASDEIANPTLTAPHGGPIVVRRETEDQKQQLISTSARFTVQIALPMDTISTVIPGQIGRVQVADANDTVWSMILRWKDRLLEGLRPASLDG